jgi:hypothetical protein
VLLTLDIEFKVLGHPFGMFSLQITALEKEIVNINKRARVSE